MGVGGCSNTLAGFRHLMRKGKRIGCGIIPAQNCYWYVQLGEFITIADSYSFLFFSYTVSSFSGVVH